MSGCLIVKGSGETDLPIVHIVHSLEEARHAVLSLMYSNPDDAEDTDELFAEFDDTMADDNYWAIAFEIGGISVERVCLAATTQGTDDTQVVIAGLNALLHDAQDEIARLTAMQGADGEILRPVAIEAPRPSVFRSFETMCWPAPCEALGEIGHRLTYDHSDKSDRLVAASVISAYQHLMSMPAKRRDAIVSELRKGPGVIAASAPMGKS